MWAHRPDPTLPGLARATALALALIAAEPAAADSSLGGRVLDADGEPARHATLFIYTASVRRGTSSFCPSCYPDCRKSAMTDREGRFTISALDDSLRFRVLIVARGWDPVFVDRVEPGAGPVEFRLVRRRLAKTDPHRSLRGRVLDPLGRPPIRLHEQPAGARPITVRMGHGGMVTGRLVHDGRPLPGVGVGLVQANRAAQSMAYGNEEIATDERGVFTFLNVTPGEDYFVHGRMASLGRFGALDTTRVRVRGEESLERVGDLVVQPGRRIAGRVVLCDGKPVPPATRLLLTLEHAWDTQDQILGEDGRFELRGVPPGAATLIVRVKGYRLARESSGYSEAYGMPACGISGDRDAEGLALVLEPGESRAVRVVGPTAKP